MCNTTRIGAATLVVALIVLRFLHAVPVAVSAAVAVVGLAVLAAGLVMDHRAKQFALTQPGPNWAEEFTAKVRREQAEAAAAREAQLLGDAAAN